MTQLKFAVTTFLLFLFIFPTQGFAKIFTECFNNTCVILTTPDQVAQGEDFEIQVEGYIENSTAWDTSAYMLLENVEWNYDSAHMVRYSGEALDVKGFNWGGSVLKNYTISNSNDPKVLTFVFGPRSRGHGYYDVAVEANVEVASSAVNVSFDIKPQSCPNPLNVHKKGLISAAIVGSVDFDVTQVDPSTIQVAGINPIHFAYEDVAEPYVPLVGKVSEFDCNDAGDDGHLDLTLKFRTEDIYESLQTIYSQPLKKGDTFTLEMTAELLDRNGHISNLHIVGEDVIRINFKR